jgi:hypothetical protein
MIPKSILTTISAPPPGGPLVAMAGAVPANARVVLAEITELTDISSEEEFFREVWEAINLANTVYEFQHGGFTARRKTTRELTRLAKMGAKYADTLRACSAHTALLLSIARPHLRPLVVPVSHLANLMAEISTAAHEAADAQTVGRQYFALKQLVLALLDAVERHGGNLTVNELGTGTLVRLLDKLRDAQLADHPLLTRRLIPNSVDVSSILQIKDDWAKSRAKDVTLASASMRSKNPATAS